jgi:Asp-tRNA(Asn)/Glu-tRNA(Gln) amidotransferase B subunit
MPTDKSARQAMISTAYEKAVKSGWNASEAAVWATKNYGSRINKADIQYHAMRSGKPYLEELRNGVRITIR